MSQAATTAPLLGPAGKVRAIFVADVASAGRQILDKLETGGDGPTVVTITWGRVPELRREVDGFVAAMAEAALSIWPHWYCSATERFWQLSDPTPDVDAVLKRAKTRALAPSEAWLRRVWKRCEHRQLPTYRKLTSAEQIRQLSRAVDPSRLIIVVTVLRPMVKKGRLQTLAKALEWMAKETDSPLVFVAPAEWRTRPELDAVTYDALTLEEIAPGAAAESRNKPIDGSTPTSTLEPGASEAGAEIRDSRKNSGVSVVVEPILGKPHPNSHVEKHLAKHLSADSELSPLFRWNHLMPVLGIGKKVDLFWEEGGVVIEIDGPDHLTAPKYNEDRDRDYRLLLEGYTSLRITNDAVNSDVAMVIEKIRMVVRLFKNKRMRKTDGIEIQSGRGALAHAHS